MRIIGGDGYFSCEVYEDARTYNVWGGLPGELRGQSDMGWTYVMPVWFDAWNVEGLEATWFPVFSSRRVLR